MTSALGAALGLAVAASAAGPPPFTELTRALAESVHRAGAEAPLGLYVRAASPELARAVATLLHSALREAGPVELRASSAAAAEEEARARGLRSLLRLTVSVESGRLVARGDLLGTWVNFWSGRSPVRPARPAAAVVQAVPADAATLALASFRETPESAPAALALEGAVFAELPARPAALAVGDLDGDGRPEVGVLTDEALRVYDAAGALRAERDLRELPASPTPCRAPFGTLALEAGRVSYFSGRLGRGEQLGWSREAGLQPVSAIASPFVLEDRQVRAVRWVPGTDQLLLGEGQAPVRAVSSALANLDGEGELELVTTSATYLPDPDTLEIRTVGDAATGVAQWALRWKAPVLRGSVLQVTAADLDADGIDELLLGTWLPDGKGLVQLYRRTR